MKSRSLLFNYYNINLTALQNYILRFDMLARDGELETATNIVGFGESPNNFRQQQQRFQIFTNKIYFLPTISIFFNNVRSWSIAPSSKADQLQKEFGFNISQSFSGSNVSLSGNLFNVLEKSTGTKDNYFQMMLNSSKEYTEKSRLDINTEYYKSNGSSYTSGSAIYNNRFSDKFRFSTSMSGRNLESANNLSTYVIINQAFQYLPTNNLQFGYNIFASQSVERYIIFYDLENYKKILNQNIGNSLNSQHMLTYKNLDFSNGINLGYGRQFGTEPQSSLNIGFQNSTNLRFENLNINTNFSANRNKTFISRQRDELYKTAALSVSTQFIKKINSETQISYFDEDIYSSYDPSRAMTQLRINQRLITSLFYVIPFSLTFNGNINWNLGRTTSRYYGVNLNFVSPHFFLQYFSVGYSFYWAYDPMTKRNYITHESEINYSWRALRFQLRLREFRYLDRKRELWFTLARPF